jgi:dihydrofolate synthase / folylpolyglutamate synthase
VNYPDSVDFLYALGNEIKTAKLGLERITAVLAALGSPQDSTRIVHVAGTNGKGSTCAMIESGLRAHGLRTGLFTSPHLSEPTERIRIDGRPIPASEFAAAFDRVHTVVEDLLRSGRIDLHTTYFETVTAMALVVGQAHRLPVFVVEVGLGGRLDATNVVHPALTVITPVDYDHEQFLGKSLTSIAGEKAGILKAGVPAILARQRPEAAAVLDRRAGELGIPVTRTSEWEICDLHLHRAGSRFSSGGLAIECPLAGEHQVENAVTAIAALRALDIPDPAIQSGIANVRWPGRLERISVHPEIVVDGAHNPAGARALAAYIDRFYQHRRVRLIFGAMRDKAIDEIAGILFPRAAEVILTAPRQARALAPEALRDAAEHPNLRLAPTVAEALAMVRDAGPGDAVFVSGSLFLVAEARDTIGVAP